MKEDLMDIICCPLDKHDLDLDVDDQASGFVATASEQEFINPIGTVSDIIGI